MYVADISPFQVWTAVGTIHVGSARVIIDVAGVNGGSVMSTTMSADMPVTIEPGSQAGTEWDRQMTSLAEGFQAATLHTLAALQRPAVGVAAASSAAEVGK